MGLAGDTLLALLEPGGIVATFTAGLVTWLASRRTECTVTAIRPDGTRITITSTRIKNLDAQQRNEFIREITAALQETGGSDRRPDDSGETGQQHDEPTRPDRQPDETDGRERQ